MIRYTKKVYIENGSNINPDWTDRIAVSYITDTGFNPLQGLYLPEILASDLGGHPDYPNQVIPVIPVVKCKYYWELFDLTETLITDIEPFYLISVPQGNNWYSMSWNKDNAGVISANIYKGRDFSHCIWSIVGTPAIPHVEHGMELVGNNAYWDAVPNNTQGSWLFKTSHNVEVVYPEQDIEVFGDETIAARFSSFMYRNVLNEIRFYFPTIGAFMRGNKDDTFKYMSYDTLLSDHSIRKSDIICVERYEQPLQIIGDNITATPQRKIKITTGGGICFWVVMGEVANKPTWTNSEGGLDIAYNEISAWII